MEKFEDFLILFILSLSNVICDDYLISKINFYATVFSKYIFPLHINAHSGSPRHQSLS